MVVERNRFLAMEMKHKTEDMITETLDNLELQVKREVFKDIDRMISSILYSKDNIAFNGFCSKYNAVKVKHLINTNNSKKEKE